jgi:predicted acetylornithine/succinylornithine family transaminase
MSSVGTTGLDALREQESRYLMGTYARQPLALVRGEGVRVWDSEGNELLDMVAGIAVNVLGHAPAAVRAALERQSSLLLHVSNLYYTEPMVEAARRLVETAFAARVFFCNSGAEANEAALKLARKFAYRKGEPNRNVILAAHGSFHGRTLGALSATDNPAYKEGFGPLPDGFAFTDFNDVAALERAIDERTACFLVEPVQGETGIVPATKAYLEAARRLCDERGALLIFDEVQTGMGRTGKLFAHQHFGVTPDAFTLAKSLANGLPIGALVVRGAAATGLRPGDHGTTFGGSPVPAAAALEHLAIRDVVDLDANVAASGELLLSELAAIASEFPGVFSPPRGVGLMLGLPVRDGYKAADFVARGLDHGIFLNAAGRNTLRFVPPLIISAEEIRIAAQRLRATIVAVLEN